MLITRAVRFLFTTTRGAVLVVFALGLLTYGGFTVFYVGTSTIKHAVDVDADLGGPIWALIDQDEYTLRAREMISGEPYRDTYRQPLFPAFHAVVLLVCGEHPTLLYNRLADAVLAAGGCVVIYLLGRRLFGHTVGLLSGLVSTVHINMVQKYGYIWAEVLAVPLLVLAVYFFVGFADNRRWRDLLLGGLFVGLSTLARPTAYYLVFLLPVWLWVLYGRIGKPMLVRSAAAVAVILVVLAPWAIHNTVLTGQFMPISGPKWTLLCGCYAPEQFDELLGANKGAFVPIWQPEYGYFPAPEQVTPGAIDRVEQEETYRELFPGILRRVWRRIPELCVYRTLVFLSLYKSPGREGIFYVAYHVQQIVLFALFVAGVWLTRRQWRRLFPVYLVLFLLGVVVALGLGGLPRWRIPVEPFIVIFASACVVWFVEKYVLRKPRPLDLAARSDPAPSASPRP